MTDTIYAISNQLIEGDPMEPSSTDIILQDGRLAFGCAVPEGWKVMTGNMHSSKVMRIAYRYEIEDEAAE